MTKKAAQFTFPQLYLIHGFSGLGLAVQAGVPTEVIDNMLVNQAVSREQADKVLQALSRRTGCHYTLSTVQVKLLYDNGGGPDIKQ